MEIELQEIVDFLSQQTLFNELPQHSLVLLVNELEIRYLRRGGSFPLTDVEGDYLYLLRSGAIDWRDEQGYLVDKLAEGDCYLLECLSMNEQDHSKSHASEDCLLYMIPCEVIQSLREKSSVFEQHFLTSVQQRMKLALDRSQNGKPSAMVMQQRVSELTDHEPLIIDINTSIVSAAMSMTEKNASSVLVVNKDQLVGIISDTDLRKRCLATNISRQEPVSKIMSTELISIEENTILSDALLTMTRHQIHHLPIMRAGKAVGILSVTELMHYLGTNSAYIASDIDKANSVERLVQMSRHLPELQSNLTMQNSSARQMGEVISSITDALTRRLLMLAEQQLGDPPVPYVWLAGGSQGRNEQTSHTDQDNAMFIDDGMRSEHESYFAALSQFVCDGLNACGYVYCPGNAMASNPVWRQTVTVWSQYFNRWINEPEKKALMLSSIFFDLRPVYGDHSLFEAVHEKMLKKARANQIFIAYMVSNALIHRPPLGFFRNFVLIHDEKHDQTLDLKHRGIVPIVDIARVYALSNGIAVSNTTERLQMAHETGAMSTEMSENLLDALEYISSLRLQHQASQIRQQISVDNYIDPKSLSGLERGHLKDAFSIIKDMQEVLENRHQTGRLT